MRKDADGTTELRTDDEILTVQQAAALVGYSVPTLRRWDRLGRLPALRTPGNQMRYRKSDLLAGLYRQRDDG